MPLPRGLPLTTATPSASRPAQPPTPLADIPLHYPNGDVRGRLAADGTNWCRCCDTTISTNLRAAFCDTHRRERNTAVKRTERGQQRPSVVGVPAEVIDVVVSRTDRLQVALGRASAEFNRMTTPPVGTWIDDLMLIAKDLTHAVDHGLRPMSSHQNTPERDRRG